jgi:hypothetical protein
MEVKSVEVEIPVPVENIPDTSAILTDAFFKKLGLNADVVVYVGTPNAQVGGGYDEVHVNKLTMPFRLFYTAFSNLSQSLKTKERELAKSSPAPMTETYSKRESVTESVPETKQDTYSIPEKDGKSESMIDSVFDTKRFSVTKSLFDTKTETVPEANKSNYKFVDFLSNISKTIATNPTKIDDTKSVLDMSEVADTVVNSVKIENKPVDKEAITTLSERIATYMGEPEKEEEKQEEEKKKETEEKVEEEKKDEEEKKEEEEKPVSPISQFLNIFSKPETESEKEDERITNIVRIKLTGKDIKEVSGKTEYSHYMDEYLLKREIDIISKGFKKMVDTKYCVQYLVDGRYVILGAIEDKPQEDLKAPEKWKIIKNTEAYKKFVQYNII